MMLVKRKKERKKKVKNIHSNLKKNLIKKEFTRHQSLITIDKIICDQNYASQPYLDFIPKC